MKTFYFTFCSLLLTCNSFSTEFFSKKELVLAKKFTSFYNELLTDQSAIQKINLVRPKIYIYTDFGGGKNQNRPLIDRQTSGEICSAAWKGTLHYELYINDSAKPLSPITAGIYLAKTFPYVANTGSIHNHGDPAIRTIAVHVIDPGVGNDQDQNNPQPRSMILRKDGVLFIGPDNGTLSFVCPQNSIAGCWEINIDALTLLSGIDTIIGGTFHGRDVFCEAAFRIAAGIVSPNDIGIKYETLDLKNRTSFDTEYQKMILESDSLEFERIYTDRSTYDAGFSNGNELFEKAFLLGIIQSSLFQDDLEVALTTAKKIFIPNQNSTGESDVLIAIINNQNGNIFIGPNNGLGSAFIKNFSAENLKVFNISTEVLESIKKENNNEIALAIIEQQSRYEGPLKEIDFLGGQKDLVKDCSGRPKSLLAKIWVDLYGNIKTTVPSYILCDAKQHRVAAEVVINGIRRQVSLAETFSQVPNEQLFIYNGSTGVIGPNPHRSNRYVELTSNGVFGKFGIDFFEKDGIKPKSGDIIQLQFKYPDYQ